MEKFCFGLRLSQALGGGSSLKTTLERKYSYYTVSHTSKSSLPDELEQFKDYGTRLLNIVWFQVNHL